AELARRMRGFLRDLVDPPDRNGDTLPDYPAVEDLNIGVISSDMGVMGYRGIRSCELADFGDDGCFRNTPSRTVPGCPASYAEKWLSRNPGNAGGYSPEQMANDFACIGTLGTAGCGFEQQFKAMRKAVVENHGIGGCNEGFLRPDSIVTLIFVTDEEDCSVKPEHPYMFDPARVGDLGGLNIRCFRNPDFVQPFSEYAAAFRSLREDPNRIFIAMIVGVPPDAPACEGDGDRLGACLAVPDMIPRPNAVGDNVEPSCIVPGLGTAYPPVRFVQLAMEIERQGVDTYVSSICRPDWTDAIGAIADRIGNRISIICLTDPEFPFDRDRCEAPGCRMVAHLGDAGPCPADPSCPCAGGTCADPYTGEPCVPLYLDDGIGVETGRRWRRCSMRQATRTAGPDGCSEPRNAGWYWQPVSSEGCGVVEFHDAWEGAAFSMECRDVP
ncbi:MAG: hypothetical protein QME96_03710, partial [Myxococcota bacterium]|nr:hypothetical protein [Myxococcota bacterium]